MMAPKKLKFIFEKAVSLAAAGAYGFMAYNVGSDWLATGRLSSLFFLVFESVIIYFFLVRDVPKKTSMLAYDWFVAVMATCLPLFLRPAPASAYDLSAPLALQLAGIAVSTLAVLSLNRSFGIVPANRGIKRGGLYRFLRHPIYAGYVVSYGAFAWQNPGPQNFAVLAAFMVFMLLRIFAEEKFLAKDPEYAAYMAKTRWRLLPGVF